MVGASKRRRGRRKRRVGGGRRGGGAKGEVTNVPFMVLVDGTYSTSLLQTVQQLRDTQFTIDLVTWFFLRWFVCNCETIDLWNLTSETEQWGGNCSSLMIRWLRSLIVLTPFYWWLEKLLWWTDASSSLWSWWWFYLTWVKLKEEDEVANGGKYARFISLIALFSFCYRSKSHSRR